MLQRLWWPLAQRTRERLVPLLWAMSRRCRRVPRRLQCFSSIDLERRARSVEAKLPFNSCEFLAPRRLRGAVRA